MAISLTHGRKIIIAVMVTILVALASYGMYVRHEQRRPLTTAITSPTTFTTPDVFPTTNTSNTTMTVSSPTQPKNPPIPGTTEPTTAVSTSEPVGSGSEVPQAPTPARQAGYHRLIINDDFSSTASIDLEDSCSHAFTWYRARPFGWPALSRQEFFVSHGVLTLNQQEAYSNWGLSTICARNGNGTHITLGYFEARMRFDPTQASAIASHGWPSFWSWSKQHLDGTSTDRAAEIDFFEAYHAPGQQSPQEYVGTLHHWETGKPNPRDSGGSYANSPSISAITGVDFRTWHRYGCLWQPGKVTWFFDGKPLHSVSYSATGFPIPNHNNNPRGTFSFFDTQPQGQALILGSGEGYPLDIDWVRVWGPVA